MKRPIGEQTIVITGASSGIGRETALRAGRTGTAVVLAARSDDALDEVAAEIDRSGGLALVVPTDVAEWPQVERLARAAIERFGRIDTWVNNAAVTEYARFEEMSVEEIDRIVRVTFLGQVYGARAALPHLRASGGTLINVASEAAYRSLPLQSIYSAAKHAVKGFTESLRLELERERSGVYVSLILPSSINTPLFEHARSRVGVLPMPVPPVYEPAAAAEAILFAAVHPRREIAVGGSGRRLMVMERISPRLVDFLMMTGGRFFRKQETAVPDNGLDNMFHPMAYMRRSTGLFGKRSRKRSLYTRLFEYHPALKGAVLTAGVTAAALFLGRPRCAR
jgi:short-subunit dehydrogenase